MAKDNTNKRIGLVDITVALNTDMIFADSATVAKTCAAIIASTGVDFGESITHMFLVQSLNHFVIVLYCKEEVAFWCRREVFCITARWKNAVVVVFSVKQVVGS